MSGSPLRSDVRLAASDIASDLTIGLTDDGFVFVRLCRDGRMLAIKLSPETTREFARNLGAVADDMIDAREDAQFNDRPPSRPARERLN